MGLQKKAEKYLNEKRQEVLSSLRQRNFTDVFSEDEKVISSLLKDLALYEDNKETERSYFKYILDFILPFNITGLSYNETEKIFSSLCETVLKSEYFFCYYNDGSKFIMTDISNEKSKDAFGVHSINSFPEHECYISTLNATDVFGKNVIEKNQNLHLDKSTLVIISKETNPPAMAYLIGGKSDGIGVYTEHEKYFLKFICAYLSNVYMLKAMIEGNMYVDYKLRYIRDRISFLNYFKKRLDSESGLCVTICKILPFKAVKNQNENYINILKNLDDTLSKVCQDNIVRIGFGFYVALYSDRKEQKRYENIFKNMRSEIRKTDGAKASLDIYTVFYDASLYKTKAEFIAVLGYCLSSERNPLRGKKSKIKNAAKKSRLQTKKTKSVKSEKDEINKLIKSSDLDTIEVKSASPDESQVNKNISKKKIVKKSAFKKSAQKNKTGAE